MLSVCPTTELYSQAQALYFKEKDYSKSTLKIFDLSETVCVSFSSLSYTVLYLG